MPSTPVYGCLHGLPLLCVLLQINKLLGILVNIQYADILKLVWPIINTNADIFLYSYFLKLYDFLFCVLSLSA